MTADREDAFQRILLDLIIPKYQKRKRDLPLRQEMSTRVLTFLILCFASAAFAEDFKTINGKEYRDATVTRVDPDRVVVKTKSGITKVYFVELPKEVQKRFQYDSEKAASYSAERNRQLRRISKAAGGNPTSTTGRRRKEQCGISGTTSRHKSHAGFTSPLRRASETGRRLASPDRRSKETRAGVPAGQVCAPPTESAKVSVAASREPFEGCSSRERRSWKATGESAALSVSKATRGRARTPKASRN
jgi:hypothetical protein